jgi:2-isopropylmalate synthase
VVSLADSVSYAVPVHFGKFCKFVRTHTPGGRTVTWSAHCHNGLGLAVANSLAAVENGFRQVEGTINGVGEGRGNTWLQGVVRALTTREDVYTSVRTGIAAEHLDETGQMLTEIAERESPGDGQ